MDAQGSTSFLEEGKDVFEKVVNETIDGNLIPSSKLINEQSITNKNLGENVSFKDTLCRNNSFNREAFHSLISNSVYYLYLGMFYTSHVHIITPDPLRVFSLGSYSNEEPMVNGL